MNEPPCFHVPVLLSEVLAALRPGPGLRIVDGTLGGGGHTEAFLERGAYVVAFDRDAEAIAAAERRLARWIPDQLEIRHGRFSMMDRLPHGTFDGVLLDLGVSSHQLDAAERGFSFRFDGPLDMRMDQGSGRPLSAILADATEDEMTEWLRRYGEEPRARAVARAIVKRRAKRPLATTQDLVNLTESVLGARGGRSHHPATRVFQAFRIAVNGELDELSAGLEAACEILAPGGRLAVISFHSLEDRATKHFLREASREFEDTPMWPNSVPNPARRMRWVSRRAIEAGPDERETNPRARSAKLRVAERIGASAGMLEEEP